MRPIDADALYELLDGGYDVDLDELPETKAELLRMIDQEETIDAVPVVRCKECKHCFIDRYGDGNAPDYVCIEWDSGTEPDGYCHMGERREEI